MGRMFQCIKNLFAYKEPINPELGFELLEGNSEEIEYEMKEPSIQEISKQYCKNQKDLAIKKRRTIRRTFLAVEKSKNTGDVSEKPENVPKKAANNCLLPEEGNLSCKLQINIEYLKQRFNMPQNQDVVIRNFNVAREINACLLFMDGMVDKNIINQFVLPQLMNAENFKDFNEDDILDHIVRNVISINQITKTGDINEIIMQVLNGVTGLFLDGNNQCLLIESKGFEKRSIDKPQTETVIRGSQEAFTENVKTNLSLLRRIIKNENLITEIVQVGQTNHANCAIVYLKGIANPELIKEVQKRVKNIDTDFIEGDGMLEQFIEDHPFMLLPQVINTERSDRAASFLMEGKVLLISEGTPFAIAVPVTFFHLLHTSEDSFLRWQYGTFLRFIRILGILISLLLPGLYIALTLYHHEMIPSQLLDSLLKAREPVPFPAILEIIMLELSFELIREGGIRVPGVIGNTLGIIGALILGQAAVSAGLVSPILIIVVAVTGIGSFVIPNYSLSLGIRILRFVITLSGALAGFYGVSLALLSVCLIACSMKSFGVPFFSPIAPKTKPYQDSIIKLPIWKQNMRPDSLNPLNKKRQGDNARGWTERKEGGS